MSLAIDNEILQEIMMLEKLTQAIASALPGEIADDVKQNIEAVLRSNLEKMDLVTREQFEIQQKILERTRERTKLLELRVQELEKQMSQEE